MTKTNFLFLFLLVGFLKGRAQFTSDYYVNLKGDTIRTEIRTLSSSKMVVRENGKWVKLKPTDFLACRYMQADYECAKAMSEKETLLYIRVESGDIILYNGFFAPGEHSAVACFRTRFELSNNVHDLTKKELFENKHYACPEVMKELFEKQDWSMNSNVVLEEICHKYNLACRSEAK